MSVAKTERGLDRLVNFSDATVAIAITLLILPLVDEASTAAHDGIGSWMSENYWQLLAFALSFGVIARFWITHHRVFEWLVTYDARLIRVNFLWLAAIAFMPFTTNALSASGNTQSAVYGLYIGNMTVVSLAMQLIVVLLRRTPELVRESARPAIDADRGWFSVGILFVAGVLSVAVPVIGMWWLLLLFLQSPLVALTRRLRRRG